MATNWSETTIGEVADVFDGPHATPRKTTSGPLFLGITSLNKGRLDLTESEHLSEEDFSKWTRRVTPQAGDVVFSYETKLGEAAIIPAGLRCCLGRRMGLMRPKPDKLDSRFLLYYYLGPEFQEIIRERTIHGSTVDRIALIEFPKFPIRIPPLPEQKAIARILGTLDDKIELNRRMNATLEAMARALFQSWFVDFDPVHAKAAGRQPAGMDPQTAALFPDSFQDSELGEIPAGWTIEPLENLAAIRGGKQLPTDDCSQKGTFPVFGANGIMGYTYEATHPAFVIAFGRVGAYCGSIHWSLDGAWINNNASAVVPMSSNEYVLQAMLGIDFHSMRTGSAQPFIPNGALASAKVAYPGRETADAFTRAVAPLRRLQAENEKQSRTLAKLRDTLLPKLLSGDLRPSSN